MHHHALSHTQWRQQRARRAPFSLVPSFIRPDAAAAMTAPDPTEVEDFLDKVSEVSILIEGLSKGTISPEYVDKKTPSITEKPKQAAAPALPSPRPTGPTSPATAAAPAADEAEALAKKAEEEEARQERLREKAKELKANYERKQKARQRFEEYGKQNGQFKAGTDYTRWDMWCPEDEEDELINSITPSSSAFRALEKDIDERHARMVEQRQIAERMRVKGNEAFKAHQYSEALRCYQEGLSSEKTNMALHSNAAMAALKVQCYVQAIEHCDKALNIADFLHNNLRDALCTKTYQRRATAYRALQQYSKAVEDMERAAANDPDSKEIQQQLARARAELEEHRKQKQLKKALNKQAKGKEGGGAAEEAGALDVDKLRRVEQLVQAVQREQQGQGQGRTEEGVTAQEGSKPRGPQLPARPAKSGKAADMAGLGAGPKPTVGDASNPSSDVQVPVVQHCSELMKLIEGDDLACVYLRECGGLQAAAQVAIASTQHAAQEQEQRQQQQQQAGACFALLNAACANDANLLLLPSLGVLPAAVQSLGSQDGFAADAALRLLCTAATNEEVRRKVSPLLGTDTGLRSMFRLLGTSSDHNRVVALAVLGNCMVDSGAREAMCKLLARGQQDKAPDAAAVTNVGPGLVALLSSRSAAVQEKALTLCGNMCGHEALRCALAAQKGLLDAAVAALFAPPVPMAGTDAQQAAWQQQLAGVQHAAAAMLYNISLDSDVQAALLDRSSAAAATGDQDTYVGCMLQLLERPGCDLRLAARVAGTVARCFKHPLRPRQQPGSRHLEQLLALLRRCSSEAASDGVKPDEDSPGVAAADAVVRCLTLCTQDDGTEGSLACDHLVKLEGPALLLQVVRQLLPPKPGQGASSGGTAASPLHATKKTRESLLGNAALCLGHLARSADVLPVLHRLDAVQPLVAVAYEGKGDVSSKNAAISLARMAKQLQMLERLRELHGIEIIYQYVRP